MVGTRSSARQGEDFYRAFLTGYGALFFAPGAVPGALFLLGTFAASALAGTAILVGLLSATAVAHLLHRGRAEIEQGLYGFNGALVAFALLSLEGVGDLLFPVLIPAAALTALITAWLLDGRWVSRLGLPVLSGPSLLVGFPLVWGLCHWADCAPHSAAVLPAFFSAGDFFRAEYYSTGMREAMTSLAGEWPVAAFFLAGFLLYSRLLLLHLIAGVALGSAIGFLFLGWPGAFDFLFVVVTAAPVFVALSAVFTAAGWRSWLYAAAGVVLSFLVWFYLGLALTDAGLPLLTAPFFLVTTALLLLLRLLPSRALSFLPRQVPLHRVGLPEGPARWGAEQDFGWRYWQEMAGLERRDWREFSDEARMERGRELVRRSRRVVVLTGAGISTESGIPDYRSGAVAWKQYDTEHFRWERFLESEESRRLYWEMSQDFFLVLRTAEPNPGHRAVAVLDRRDKLRAVITQNVDRLHQAAGVPEARVLEIHGNEHHVSCLSCGAGFEREEVHRWIVDGLKVPYCPTCQGILKPDSVAFGQPMPVETSRIALEAVQDCDLLVVAGTSLEVQPVSTLPLLALRAGKPLLLVNLEPTDYDAFATQVFRGTCGAILPELFGTAD